VSGPLSGGLRRPPLRAPTLSAKPCMTPVSVGMVPGRRVCVAGFAERWLRTRHVSDLARVGMGPGMLSKNDLEAIRSVERVIEASQNLRRLLEIREEELRRAVSVREPTTDYATSVKQAHVTENREDLNEALFLFDNARRESRIASFRSALDHGVSINELSRMWGFSRQMASRYAKEAREEY
jgi:hypothetical protein